MSLVSIVLIALGAALLAVLLLTGVALFSPLVFTLDSGNWQVRVRWLGAMEYRRPLPGGKGESGLLIAGRSVGLPARKARRKPERVGAAGRKYAKAGRFARRCLREPAIRNVLARKFGELVRGILRSVCFSRRQITVSLPDPAWNGMLAGWLAQCGDSRGMACRINFTGENGVLFVGQLYPYRITKALLLFLAGLPYRMLYREWRACSATGSG